MMKFELAGKKGLCESVIVGAMAMPSVFIFGIHLRSPVSQEGGKFFIARTDMVEFAADIFGILEGLMTALGEKQLY